MIRQLIGAWQSLVRQFGPAVAVLYLCHRFLGRVSAGRMRIVPYLLYAQPIGSVLLAGVRDDPSTVVRQIEAGDPLERDFPRPAVVIGQRHASGAECHVAVVKDVFAGYIWIAHQRYDEDEVRCEYVIDPQCRGVWDFDVFVTPALRTGRTMARLWKAVDHSLTQRGVQWTFSRISAFNPGSLASHRRLGAVAVDKAVFFVAGRWQLLLASQRPYMHASWGPAFIPRLWLRSPSR